MRTNTYRYTGLNEKQVRGGGLENGARRKCQKSFSYASNMHTHTHTHARYRHAPPCRHTYRASIQAGVQAGRNLPPKKTKKQTQDMDCDGLRTDDKHEDPSPQRLGPFVTTGKHSSVVKLYNRLSFIKVQRIVPTPRARTRARAHTIACIIAANTHAPRTDVETAGHPRIQW